MTGNTPWRTTRASRMLALVQGHNDWYKISNLSDGRTQVSIYDEIGFFGMTAADLIKDLAGVEGPLDVRLNSPGGEVNDGIAIYNTLLNYPDVDIYIDGLAASIASVIAMAGTRIHIAPSAQMMVHNAFTMAIGDADDLRELADRLEENTQNIARIYAKRTGQTEQYWRDVMKSEQWYRGQEAIDAGLADDLIQARQPGRPTKDPAANFDMAVFRNTAASPEKVQDAAAGHYTSQTDTAHPPVTGQHSHNHASFGHDQDAVDGIHHHSHYHENDAVHDHTHMVHEHEHDHEHPHSHAHDAGQDSWGSNHGHDHTHHVADGHQEPDGDEGEDGSDGEEVGVPDHSHNAVEDDIQMHIDLHNASFDGSSWDGGAAMSAAGNSSNPAAAFNSICAGKRAGDPALAKSHALPHHKHPGSPPNRAGVNNALARLSGTQGLTNKSAAEAHLKAHQAAWGGGSDAEDSAQEEVVGYTDDEIAAFSGQFLASLKGES